MMTHFNMKKGLTRTAIYSGKSQCHHFNTCSFDTRSILDTGCQQCGFNKMLKDVQVFVPLLPV